MNINYSELLESKSYQEQKEVLFNEVNGVQVPHKIGERYVAPTSSMPCPSRVHHVNRAEFEHTEQEKGRILTFKKHLGKSKNHKFQTLIHLST